MAYPHWWDTTITLYHKVLTKDDNGRTHTKWVRLVINNCFYGNEKRQVLSGAVISNADKHIVRIPYDKNVTLSKGDIIIKGVATEDIADNSSGKEVLATYTESFIVDVVKTNDKTKRLKHIYGGD